MTTIQLKAQMHHIIDEMPESKITEVFNYLKSVQYDNPEYDKIDQIIDKIFEQEDNLLRRLAE
jgi:hypothetical protein